MMLSILLLLTLKNCQLNDLETNDDSFQVEYVWDGFHDEECSCECRKEAGRPFGVTLAFTEAKALRTRLGARSLIIQ